MLLVSGVGSQATARAVEYLLDRAGAADLLARLSAGGRVGNGALHFQAVLVTEVRSKVALRAELVHLTRL